MTEIVGNFKTGELPNPLFGVPIAADQDLPAPAATADEVVTVPADAAKHQVEIFIDDDEATRHEVQKLHGEVFVERGIISPDQLTDGRYVDEYSDRSTHVYIRNGTKVGGVRAIHADKKQGGLLSLPTTKHFEIDPEELRATADVHSLNEIKAHEVDEISGLVARKQAGAHDTIAAMATLYARLLRNAMEGGTKLWVANVEPTYIRYLGGILGPDQVHQLGKAKEYKGPATVPIAINPLKAVESVLEGRDSDNALRQEGYKIAAEVFQGVDDRKIPAHLRKLLKEHGIATTEYSPVKRILKDPKAIAYAGILAYSSARAFPAAGVDEFDGSTALLWGIDVATAVPYTWGVIETFTPEPRSLTRRAAGAAVASSSFAAPYVYFAAEGHNYPTYVNVVIAGMVGAAVAKEALSTFFGRRKRAAINEGLTASDLQDKQPKKIRPASLPQSILPKPA